MHHIFSDMFVLSVPLLEKILRPVCVYAFLVLLLRVFGKRELAQLNPFDLVVLLSLANTVQNAIIGDDNSVAGGLIGAFTLLFVNYLVVRFLFRHRRLDQIVEGRPTVLVRDGRVCKDQLARELISVHELQVIIPARDSPGCTKWRAASWSPAAPWSSSARSPPRRKRSTPSWSAGSRRSSG